MSHNHYTQFFFICQVLATKKNNSLFFVNSIPNIIYFNSYMPYKIAKNVSKKKRNRMDFVSDLCAGISDGAVLPLFRGLLLTAVPTVGGIQRFQSQGCYGAVKRDFRLLKCCELLYPACFQGISRCCAGVADIKMPFPRRCASIATVF